MTVVLIRRSFNYLFLQFEKAAFAPTKADLIVFNALVAEDSAFWSRINCIFAETGADREINFDKETEVERLYNSNDYPSLLRKMKLWEESLNDLKIKY